MTAPTLSLHREHHLDLPAARELFPEFLASIYLSRPAPISIPDIFRVTEITITAQLSVNEHKPLAC